MDESAMKCGQILNRAIKCGFLITTMKFLTCFFHI